LYSSILSAFTTPVNNGNWEAVKGVTVLPYLTPKEEPSPKIETTLNL